MSLTDRSAQAVIIVFIFSLAFAVLAGSTVNHTTPQYDEYTDLVIASELSQHPLSGHSYDGSQARFPMYVTAAAYRLARVFIPSLGLLDLLPVSRWISIFMTVAAIWGTYLLGRRLFGTAAGILAAFLFTFSPLVLHFGRDALTQGDAFTAATVVFSLIAFERFEIRRTTFWLVAFAFCLALAIGAKFLLAFLIPALIAYQLIVRYSGRFRTTEVLPHSGNAEAITNANRGFIILATGTGFAALVALLLSIAQSGQWAMDLGWLNRAPRLLWAATLVGLLAIVLLAIRDLGLGRRPVTQPALPWGRFWAWLAILPISFAVLLAVFPAHIFNPNIMPTLLERFITMDGNSDLLATSIDSFKLYLGLSLFKLGLPFGILTVLAFLWALDEALRNSRMLILIITLAFYGLMLALLPLQQPFWLMSVYPLGAIVLSAMIVRIYQQLPAPRLKTAWAATALFAMIWLIAGVVRVYPTFGYYGYEIVGDQWLGASSRGFRSLVVVTNDGSTETYQWLRHHAPADSVVVSYMNDVHIMNYLSETEPLEFEFMQALKYADENELERDLARADYLVIPLVNETSFPYPSLDPDFFQSFGAEPVFQVIRGRGIYQMPVIQVFQRVPSLNQNVAQ